MFLRISGYFADYSSFGLAWNKLKTHTENWVYTSTSNSNLLLVSLLYLGLACTLSSKNTHKWKITVLHLLSCHMIWYLQLLVTGLWSVNEGGMCQAPPIFLVNPFFPFNKYLVGRPSNFSFTSFSIYWRLSPEPITMIVKWFSNSTIHFTFTGWHYTESPSFLGIHGFLFYLMVYNLLLTFIFVSKCWLGHWIPL